MRYYATVVCYRNKSWLDCLFEQVAEDHAIENKEGLPSVDGESLVIESDKLIPENHYQNWSHK